MSNIDKKDVVILPSPLEIHRDGQDMSAVSYSVSRTGDSFPFMEHIPHPMRRDLSTLLRLKYRERTFFEQDDINHHLQRSNAPKIHSYIPWEGLYVLANSLKNTGISFSVYDVDLMSCKASNGGHRLTINDVVANVAARQPKVVAIGMNHGPALENAKEIITKTRALHPETQFLTGGRYATSATDEMLQSGFDFVFRGEADVHFPRIIKDILGGDTSSTPSLSFAKDGTIMHNNPPKTIIRKSGELMAPDYSLIPPEDRDYVDQVYLSLARGCPYLCTFCAHPALYDQSVLHKDVGALEGEIRDILEIFPQQRDKLFMLKHVSFGVNTKWTKEFCEMLIDNKFYLKWSTEMRPDTIRRVDESILRLMSRSGLVSIFMGVESLTDEALLGANKMYTREDILKALEKVKGVIPEVIMYTYWLLGLPKETLDSILENVVKASIKLLKEGYIDVIQPHILTPLPGTKLTSDCESVGLKRVEPGVSQSFYCFDCSPWFESDELTEYELFALYTLFLAELAKHSSLEAERIRQKAQVLMQKDRSCSKTE